MAIGMHQMAITLRNSHQRTRMASIDSFTNAGPPFATSYLYNILPMSEKFIPEVHAVQNFGKYKANRIFADLLPAEGFSLRYDSTGEFLAVGCYNGTKLLYSSKKQLIEKAPCPNEDPVTCLKWRPGSSKGKVLGVTNAAGIFDYLHVPSLKRLFSIEEKENSLHCCDFTTSGGHFATAGRDCHIRVYDQNTKSVSVDLGCAEWNYRGHSNRIFSVKFIDDNSLVSGGWDSVLHQWDLRVGKSVRAIFGPHVAGDAIDFRGNELLVGCYAAKNQIQVWDYNKFQMREGISWTSSEEKDRVAYVYTATFHKSIPNTIVAGACGVNEVKVFHREAGSYSLSTVIRNLEGGCFSVDTNPKQQQFGFTTSKDSLYLYTETQ